MKIVCDCGNEEVFCETRKEGFEYINNYYTSGQGLYTTIETFRMWETHDIVGIVCEKCGKDIWMFT